MEDIRHNLNVHVNLCIHLKVLFTFYVIKSFVNINEGSVLARQLTTQ